MNVPAGAKVPCVLVDANADSRRLADQWEIEACRMARLSELEFADQVPEGAAQIVFGEATIALPLKGVIDFDAEKARLAKASEKIAKEINSIEGRLGNAGFVAKAPPHVIEETKDKLQELKNSLTKTKEALERLARVA